MHYVSWIFLPFYMYFIFQGARVPKIPYTSKFSTLPVENLVENVYNFWKVLFLNAIMLITPSFFPL
ncbi:hypothetical protein B5E43_05590 [Flavonifractor sp. An100]|nr:hypothetical protein B5E43_05590 [Flavonifractor sp. An100]